MNIDENKDTILLVDDEKDNLELMNRTLRQDFNILKTTSPLEGLKILEETPVNLIISDHKMEEMDGTQFLKKSIEIQPQAVRLLVTAYSDSQILIDAINKGKVYRYVKKPWEPSELIVTVKAGIEYNQLKIENDRLIYDLKGLFSGTIKAIIEALDAKDSFTMGRSRRVTLIALKMAKYFNLPMEEIGKLELAGLLHDIGMIGIPEDILNKTTELTPEEFDTIKKHVEHGVKILEDIKQLKEVVEIIKYHHERFDGKGYPYGITNEQIPFNAKIIAIADTYDGLVSNRSYREGLTHEAALKQIEKQIGTQFDPIIANAFQAIIPEAINELKVFEEQIKKILSEEKKK